MIYKKKLFSFVTYISYQKNTLLSLKRASSLIVFFYALFRNILKLSLDNCLFKTNLLELIANL